MSEEVNGTLLGDCRCCFASFEEDSSSEEGIVIVFFDLRGLAVDGQAFPLLDDRRTFLLLDDRRTSSSSSSPEPTANLASSSA